MLQHPYRAVLVLHYSSSIPFPPPFNGKTPAELTGVLVKNVFKIGAPGQLSKVNVFKAVYTESAIAMLCDGQGGEGL